MSVELWVWIGFFGLIAALVGLDLFVLRRDARKASVRESAIWSALWISLGLAFGGVIWLVRGAEAGGEYLAGYLIEKSLSVDNMFVFASIFSSFAVPAAYQHRVLLWGVLGAMILRAVFITAGAALLTAFHWMIYIFGALLLITGIKMATKREGHAVNPEQNLIVRVARRIVPTTSNYHGSSFFVKQAGKWAATPLFLVLLVVEVTDVIFAVDSIPAIFAVTEDPFIVFSSNAFAILGLRSLYFLLADLLDRFVYLQAGLAAILMFVGSKMLISDFFKIPIWWSLGVILITLVVAIVASLIKTARPLTLVR